MPGISLTNPDDDGGLVLVSPIEIPLIESEPEEVLPPVEEEMEIEEIQQPEPEIAEEEQVETETVASLIIPAMDNPFSSIDYNSWTVRELQEECRERGITIRGTKAEVVLRLRRNDDGIMDDTANGESEAPSEEAAEETQDAPSEEAVTPGDENADSEQGEYTSEEE